jgi:hypothetical protein
MGKLVVKMKKKYYPEDEDMLRLAEPMKKNSYGQYMINLVKNK